jgi:hypothetical protein
VAAGARSFGVGPDREQQRSADEPDGRGLATDARQNGPARSLWGRRTADRNRVDGTTLLASGR